MQMSLLEKTQFLSPCRLNHNLKRMIGSVTSRADVGVVEVLLCSPYLPGGVLQGPQQEEVLAPSSVQQEKCHSDVGGGKVGGSPWLVRKYCFYVIAFDTPATCGK